MQPTVTPADAIVNAFQKLRNAILGIQHSKDDAHFEALHRLESTLQPSDKQAIKAVEQAKLPRVAQQSKFSQHVPRVHFNDAPSTVYDPPPRLIVALLEKQHVAKSIVAPPLKPIIKPPKYVDESIAVAHDVSNIKHWSTNPLPIV